MSKNEFDKKEAMLEIVAKVGKERAIDLVMQSYNTELITTLLNRLEDAKSTGMIGGYKRRDQLEDALRRVREVCDLT